MRFFFTAVSPTNPLKLSVYVIPPSTRRFGWQHFKSWTSPMSRPP